MAFRFPLAAVLRLREIEEQREERLLMEILAELARMRERAAALAVYTVESVRRGESALASRLSAPEVQTIYALADSLKKQKLAIELALQELEIRRQAQTSRYQAARQARELLSGMQNEQRVEFVARLARQEQKTLDDIFTSRHRGPGAN